MGKQTIEYLKTKFATGMRPTGENFADLIDTLENEDYPLEDMILDLGVVGDALDAFAAAAAAEVVSNPRIRAIVWRMSDSSDDGGKGSGGTIFQERWGNWYVTQWLMFDGRESLCRVRRIITGGNYQCGDWQTLVLPTMLGFNASTGAIMWGGANDSQATRQAVVISQASASGSGLMSEEVFNRLGTGASISEGTATETDVPVSYPNWAEGGARTFTLNPATSDRAGVMTAADKTKLDNIHAMMPQVLQRGMISLGAKPGVVYRNLGYIRVPLSWRATDENETWLGTVDADLSGVDLDWVEDVFVGYDPVQGPIDCNVLTLDRENKRLKIEVTICIENGVAIFPVARLTLLQTKTIEGGLSRRFVCRMADGKIRPIGMAFNPADVPPEAPVIKATNVMFSDIDRTISVIYGLCRALVPGDKKLEIQSKSFGRKHIGVGLHKTVKSRWHRRFNPNGKDRGVLRVRIAAGRRRAASPWVYFSYKTFYQNPSEARGISVKPL